MQLIKEKVLVKNPETAFDPISVTKDQKKGVRLYIYAVAIAALLSAIGILWDISWHASVGRDKFLSPPHILIYIGAIFGGLFSAIQVIINTFVLPLNEKSSYVKVWGVFYSSLGSMFCIWGAIAMLTSAPFDNWWHAAYGLDVKVFSPPHSLLLTGIFFLEFGGCICINKYINQAEPNDKSLRMLQFLYIITASSLLCMLFTISNPIIKVRYMRSAYFYMAATTITLLLLPAFSRSLRMKWGMTAVATGYFLLQAIVNWTLQLFPAEPKLGPILTHITHFQPAMFPMLIMVPAIFMDIAMARLKGNDWIKACTITIIFVSIFVLIQYPLSGFLLQSPGARNWFFGADSWFFGNPPDSPFRYKFIPSDVQRFPAFAIGILITIVIGIIISRISLKWGNWMLRIQR